MTLVAPVRYGTLHHSAIEPFFFGAGDASLFGLHSPPTAAPTRTTGILLCHPVGHEYVVSHRAYRQLSVRLAAAGFHVLRFDYHATGDSAGACEEGTPARWRRDIGTAIDELRHRADCASVSIIGCRLGATLAALVAAERRDVAYLALWDAVENGAAHIAEVSQTHASMLRRTQVMTPPPARDDGDIREFLGFATAGAALREIGALDLLAMTTRPAPHLLVIDSRAHDNTARLRKHVTELGASVTHRQLLVPDAWSWIEDPGTILVPPQIIGAIVDWMSEVAT